MIRIHVTEVDPVRQQELILKRAALKQAAKLDATAARFKSLLSPLDAAGVQYVVIPKAGGALAAWSALAALAAFPFDTHGHLIGDRHVPVAEWRSLFSEQFVSGKRAYLAWKDQECCIDVLLADVLPVLSEVFIDYYWDAYLFDPFGGWVIESHHDGFLSVIGGPEPMASRDVTWRFAIGSGYTSSSSNRSDASIASSFSR